MILSERRLDHLRLEEPELLLTGEELLQMGLIRCGGGVPVRNDNGKLVDILNVEITAAGKKFLEEAGRAGTWYVWAYLHRNQIRFGVVVLGLAILVLLAWINRLK